MTILRMLGITLSFFSNWWLVTQLGTEDFGLLMYFISQMMFFGVILSFGLMIEVSRCIRIYSIDYALLQRKLVRWYMLIVFMCICFYFGLGFEVEVYFLILLAALFFMYTKLCTGVLRGLQYFKLAELADWVIKPVGLVLFLFVLTSAAQEEMQLVGKILLCTVFLMATASILFFLFVDKPLDKSAKKIETKIDITRVKRLTLLAASQHLELLILPNLILIFASSSEYGQLNLVMQLGSATCIVAMATEGFWRGRFDVLVSREPGASASDWRSSIMGWRLSCMIIPMAFMGLMGLGLGDVILNFYAIESQAFEGALLVILSVHLFNAALGPWHLIAVSLGMEKALMSSTLIALVAGASTVGLGLDVYIAGIWSAVITLTLPRLWSWFVIMRSGKLGRVQ